MFYSILWSQNINHDNIEIYLLFLLDRLVFLVGLSLFVVCQLFLCRFPYELSSFLDESIRAEPPFLCRHLELM